MPITAPFVLGTDSSAPHSTSLRVAQNDSKSTMVAATVVPLRHPERSAKHEVEGSVLFLGRGVQHGFDEDAGASALSSDQITRKLRKQLACYVIR